MEQAVVQLSQKKPQLLELEGPPRPADHGRAGAEV